MNHEYDTWELAKAYEIQGYYQDALDICVRLNRRHEGRDKDVLAACTRLEKILEQNTPLQHETVPDFSKEHHLALLVEEWLRLWVMKFRMAALDNLILQVRRNP